MLKKIGILKDMIVQYQDLQKGAKHLAQTMARNPGDFEAAYNISSTSGKFIPSQRRLEIKYLYDLIRVHKCKSICEIGTLLGGTLFMLCQAAPANAKIVSVDIHSSFIRRQALRQLKQPDQQLKLIVGDSHSIAVEKRLRSEFGEKGLDFLFIDGDHSLFGVLNDFARYSPLVTSGGIIALHDIHPDSYIRTGIKTKSNVGGVPYFWEMIKKLDYRTEQFIEDPNQDGYGIGIIYKNRL